MRSQLASLLTPGSGALLKPCPNLLLHLLTLGTNCPELSHPGTTKDLCTSTKVDPKIKQSLTMSSQEVGSSGSIGAAFPCFLGWGCSSCGHVHATRRICTLGSHTDGGKAAVFLRLQNELLSQRAQSLPGCCPPRRENEKALFN